MNFSHPLPPLEIWGGVKCTINRVGNTYFDQLKRNGHESRLEDLHRFADNRPRRSATIHTLTQERMLRKQQSRPYSFSCILQSERGQLLPSLDDALSRYRQERIA